MDLLALLQYPDFIMIQFLNFDGHGMANYSSEDTIDMKSKWTSTACANKI